MFPALPDPPWQKGSRGSGTLTDERSRHLRSQNLREAARPGQDRYLEGLWEIILHQQYNDEHGETVSKIRLVDAETGVQLRHYVRTLREANREREWYEEETGRPIRIVKVFDTSPDE
ncbi:MAG: hypothetical protein APR53_10465 [Methanoculleus sp. SDB]|nr:MAG: hypothetical protein APR53_10465 [Methanoculleus sp. SDB]